MHGLFAHDARHFGARPALRIDGEALTYSALARRVEALAHVLRPHVSAGARVALWLPNGFDWVASFLAVNALGAVSVPMSTRLTASEVRYILVDAGVTAVVASEHYRGRDYADELAAMSSEVEIRPVVIACDPVKASDKWRVAPVRMPAARKPTALPADVFCIQYTSGTTSRPKGVMLTDAAYIRTASYVARCDGVTPSTSFFSAAPFFHCSGSMHALTVCLVGGCTLNSFSRWDPEFFIQQLQQHSGDISHGIFFRDIFELPPSSWGKLATLKVGHALGTPDYLRRIHDDLGVKGISNVYGMSETCGQFTMWHPGDPLDKRIGGNGRCQAGNAVRVVHPSSGAPCQTGETGEIQLHGSTLTPGYVGRSPSDVFTADGWLATGDSGYVTPEQELIFVARTKDLIRVGGENFSPDEVEEQLRSLLPGVQVAVVGIEDSRLGEVPVAVLSRSDGMTAAELTECLRTHLARFKVPSHFYLCEEFPLTATNKIQRAELKARAMRPAAAGGLRSIE